MNPIQNLKLKWTKRAAYFLALSLFLYGINLIYYQTTDGFLLSNITSDFTYDPRWETRALSPDEQNALSTILQQPYRYLGKGCQSYVFGSEDGKYVIKFFKYQRFRPKPWGYYVDFLPGMKTYLRNKEAFKKKKREGVFESWKLAHNKLSGETGVVYVHLNKTHGQHGSFIFYDKLGIKHEINLDNFEFMVQKQAKMLCDEIDGLMGKGKDSLADALLGNLLDRLLSEYHRGFADNDHALMQNTGVYEGTPIHVDVGQFAEDESIKNPDFYLQELYTKTYKFRLWLKEKHPSLAQSFDKRLESLYGEKFSNMQPHWRNKMEIFQD